MSSRSDREGRLIRILLGGSRPVPARALAGQLDVSERSIRNYVSAINSRAGDDLIGSTPSGYLLRREAYHRLRLHGSAVEEAGSLPERRLNSILRTLVDTGRADVFELEESLRVSVPTIEADLSRARAVLREYGLSIRRTASALELSGSERQRRRFLRSLLYHPSEGSGMTALARVRADPRSGVGRLHRLLVPRLAELGIELNQYVLGDLLVHLEISAERPASAGRATREGVPAEEGLALPPAGAEESADAQVLAAVSAIAGAFSSVYGARLGGEEREILYQYIAVSEGRRHGVAPGATDDVLQGWVEEAIEEICALFALERPRPEALESLVVHTRSLYGRVVRDRQWSSPPGGGFRSSHPLIHEITLQLAGRLEACFGTALSPGETDFLSFHVGTYFQPQIDAGPRVTYTVVTPRYGAVSRSTVDRIESSVTKTAMRDRVITDVTADLTGISSDLVFSTVETDAAPEIPVVRISPFVDAEDAARMNAAVEEETRRRKRRLVRETLIRMLDPRLFVGGSRWEDHEAAIDAGAGMLESHGYVRPGFAEAVLDRERRSSTSFGGGFAIPHSLRTDALKTGICVIRSERPIRWHSEGVRLVLLFSISPDGLVPFRTVLDLFIRALSEPSTVDRLVAATGYEAFVAVLSEAIA